MQLISAPNAPRETRVGHVQLFVGYARIWRRGERNFGVADEHGDHGCFARSTAAGAVVKNPWGLPRLDPHDAVLHATPLSGPPNLNPTFLARSSSRCPGPGGLSRLPRRTNLERRPKNFAKPHRRSIILVLFLQASS